MAATSYRQVLKLAQQLPFSSQLELAETLLGNVRATLDSSVQAKAETGLAPLTGMSESELKALAEAVVSPERQQHVQALLALNRDSALDTGQESALDNLIDEIDQVALLKARALYTLHATRAQSRGN
jgi:hypothetical protein